MTLTGRTILRIAFMVPCAAAMLFLPAWSWRFWQGWIYLILVLSITIPFMLWLLKRRPELMERRLRIKEKDPAQKLFQILWTPIFSAAFLLTGFDFRFGWSRRWIGTVPTWLVLAADGAVLVGACFIFWAMKTNAFAGRTIQVDEGQTVITSGPYAIVRHPFYCGTLFWTLATPLALGSFVTIPLFAALAPILIYRLIHEEAVLRRDLAGYAEYCERTRFRLVPRVW